MYIDTIDMTEPDTETTVTYAIRDTSSGYVTPSTSALTNYYTKNTADGKYQLMLTAGEHIIINGSNQISAVWNTATNVLDGLMSSTDKGNLDAAVGKLSTIAEGAQANQVNDVIVNGDTVVNAAKQAIIVIPTKLSDLQNDSGFITSPTDVKIGVTGNTSSVITGGIATLITNSPYNASTNKLATMNDITASQPGTGILTLKVNDTSIGTFSANATSNVSINVDLSNYATIDDLTNYAAISTLAAVSFSGDYDDLINKPVIFSGDYDDLVNKPTIPSKTSDLNNDSGFITSNYFTTITGYNASATQTLKNVNGTLTWVTDTI